MKNKELLLPMIFFMLGTFQLHAASPEIEELQKKLTSLKASLATTKTQLGKMTTELKKLSKKMEALQDPDLVSDSDDSDPEED